MMVDITFAEEGIMETKTIDEQILAEISRIESTNKQLPAVAQAMVNALKKKLGK
jgi:hypothetical protein